MPTGEIELRATEIEILSEAKTPPFYINEPDKPVDESLRLKYRYLDIRRQPMADRLLLRSRMVQAIRRGPPRARFRRGRNAVPHQIDAGRGTTISLSRRGSSRAVSMLCRSRRSCSSSC